MLDITIFMDIPGTNDDNTHNPVSAVRGYFNGDLDYFTRVTMGGAPFIPVSDGDGSTIYISTDRIIQFTINGVANIGSAGGEGTEEEEEREGEEGQGPSTVVPFRQKEIDTGAED